MSNDKVQYNGQNGNGYQPLPCAPTPPPGSEVGAPTLADVQPGGRVRLATVLYDRAHDLLADAYNAGTHGIGYSQQAMELHDAIIPAQPSPGGQGDALVEAAMTIANAAHDRALMSDILSGMRAHEAQSLKSAILALDAALAARQPVGEDWQHIANEWADATANGVQWLRNIRDGASTVADALACMERNVERIQQLKPQPVGEPVAAVTTSDRFAYGKLNRELPDGTELYAAPPAQAVDLGQMPHGVRLVEIPRRNGLDPINVFVQDYELGRGRIVVTCYGQAWCGFWGAMGDSTVMQFVAACDADYVAGNLLSGRHEHVKKHERTYVERIATEVIAEFRALIDGKAVGNGQPELPA